MSSSILCPFELSETYGRMCSFSTDFGEVINAVESSLEVRRLIEEEFTSSLDKKITNVTWYSRAKLEPLL